LIVLISVATALALFWLALLAMVSRDDWIAAAYNKVLDNLAAMEKLRLRDAANCVELARYQGAAAAVMRVFRGADTKKKLAKLERNSEFLRNGNLRGINIFIMPGYVWQRKFAVIGRGAAYRMILTKSFELYGKKYAENRSKQLLAKLLSYPLIGSAAALALSALCLGAGYSRFGLALAVLGPVIVLLYAYSLYDALDKETLRRRQAISRQFPHVVSKLALLVTSGMIMDRAWQETAYSQEAELYLEMRKTTEELDNLVSPETAYSGFINRCNTKETTKLASAIMQNLAKGNAEAGLLLKTMAREAWLERRHTAKRDSEKANAQLLIPMMLLFFAILMMIMAPIAMNFTVF